MLEHAPKLRQSDLFALDVAVNLISANVPVPALGNQHQINTLCELFFRSEDDVAAVAGEFFLALIR